MHGLTGGSWKRSYDQATATEKNNPTGNRAVLTAPRPTAAQTPPRQLPTLHRLSSGSYFPPPVKAVAMPKPGGGSRILGVPTVDDRIAQTVAAMYLERQVEPVFHPDSHGYRPGRSALDAVGRCRERCWRDDWVIGCDVRAFFDSVDHSLMLKAVKRHTDQRWILLYVTRWLAAPIQQPDGTLVARDRGTPQGSAISPVLANLYLHYAFDMWLVRTFRRSRSNATAMTR